MQKPAIKHQVFVDAAGATAGGVEVDDAVAADGTVDVAVAVVVVVVEDVDVDVDDFVDDDDDAESSQR